MAISSIAGATCAGKSDDFDADDSGAQQHELDPPTADEVEDELAAFFAEFTAPRRKRVTR